MKVPSAGTMNLQRPSMIRRKSFPALRVGLVAAVMLATAVLPKASQASESLQLHEQIEYELAARLLLIDAGEDPNEKDVIYGRTTLHLAAGYGDEYFTAWLIGKGADVAAKDDDGNTPLHWAAAGGHEGVVRLLLDEGADLAAESRDSRTPLHHAALNGHEGVAVLLIDAGADPAAKDGDGRTPLELARGEGHANVVRLLIERGGNLTD